MHHFMSNSPWSVEPIFEQIQAEIGELPCLQKGGALVLDESAVEKCSEKTAGAGRQHNGRLGKIEMSQVGVFLAYANVTSAAPVWTWVDGELFLPQHWFDAQWSEERTALGIPPERRFATKIELGWQMIQRAQARGLPFEVVVCDDLYGRSQWFRAAMREHGLTYVVDVPRDTRVYTSKRAAREAARGKADAAKSRQADKLAAEKSTVWKQVFVRHTERGPLRQPFVSRRVFTLWKGKPVEEWLLIREEGHGKRTYSLSNAPAQTSLTRLARWKCQRHFVEVANREAKTEAGWDELRARKYRAWEHHLGLTALACWFIAQTKLDWALQHPRDESLHEELGIKELPALSIANVRELLRAAMPLPQLSPERATELVAQHLVNRSRSQRSRCSRTGKAPP